MLRFNPLLSVVTVLMFTAPGAKAEREFEFQSTIKRGYSSYKKYNFCKITLNAMDSFNPLLSVVTVLMQSMKTGYFYNLATFQSTIKRGYSSYVMKTEIIRAITYSFNPLLSVVTVLTRTWPCSLSTICSDEFQSTIKRGYSSYKPAILHINGYRVSKRFNPLLSVVTVLTDRY